MLIKDNFEKRKPRYANLVAKNFYDGTDHQWEVATYG